LPDNIVRSSDATIPLSWNSSTHADGYFVVVEAENTASGVAGYSEFFSSGVTAGSIPISAFHNAQGFKEGTYYVWVVAYHDNPIEYPGISFSLPAGFQNNISRVGVTGQGGAMYIPPKLVLTAQTN
ncbi:MAG: hypothetical protein KAT58_11850, partial [candidate division Zixibacteria bacterium]|nr:hypothetical protein [candidate division Zixibacteria bacterium]